jgi:hypothetical protein
MDTFESDWDDIELTPVSKATEIKGPHADQSIDVAENLSDSRFKAVKENISSEFKALDENFMYLGVLKKLALPDAMKFFKTRLPLILLLLEKVWENKAYPEKEALFSQIGEDYPSLSRLIHSGDAVAPIYEHSKNLYTCVEQLKEAGIKRQDAMALLKTLADGR